MLFLFVLQGESYYFVFEKWFGVEKEDGKLEREVMAADGGLGFVKVRSRLILINSWKFLVLSCVQCE
jgi:hypothetical protein